MSPSADKPRVALSVSSFGETGDPRAYSMLEDAAEIVPNPHGRKLSEDEVAALLADVVGVIAGTEPLTARVMEAAPDLRVISRVGVGMDNVDLGAARERGIAVVNTPDAVTDAAAELALGGMLAVKRRLGEMDREMRAGRWTRRMGGLMRGKTVGIVGYGRIGHRVAELLAPFEGEVLVHDPAHSGSIPLSELLERADVVTLHAAAGEEILGAAEIARMKEGAVLVNAARGGLVDEAALEAALREERLAGAFLDVFASEPYDGPLTELENVIVTPHAGSYAREARIAMENEAVEKLLEALGT